MLSDDEVKSFLSSKNLKLTKENSNPRPFDQKVTMDNLNTVAYLIDQIVKEDQKQNFTTTYIWKHDASEEYVLMYGKGSVFDKKKDAEWNKFFPQPMNFLTYFGVLSRDESKTPHKYKINNKGLLEFIKSQPNRSLKFLVYATKEFIKQNNLTQILDTFFKQETKNEFNKLRKNLENFIYNNTMIERTNKHEPSRIYNKIINHIAYDLEKKGNYNGRMSEDIIQIEELQYNQKNWYDILSGKPKKTSRAEYKKEYYANLAEESGIDVSERIAKKNIVKKHGYISEYSGKDTANETHHIFMKSEYSKLRFLHENLIRITAGEHLENAHPLGNRLKVDEKFQIELLLAKLKSILSDQSFYDFKTFVYVLNTGFNEKLDDNASADEIKDFLIKRLEDD
jgi:hypothetical protein